MDEFASSWHGGNRGKYVVGVQEAQTTTTAVKRASMVLALNEDFEDELDVEDFASRDRKKQRHRRSDAPVANTSPEEDPSDANSDVAFPCLSWRELKSLSAPPPHASGALRQQVQVFALQASS